MSFRFARLGAGAPGFLALDEPPFRTCAKKGEIFQQAPMAAANPRRPSPGASSRTGTLVSFPAHPLPWDEEIPLREDLDERSLFPRGGPRGSGVGIRHGCRGSRRSARA